jgi:peptidyl-prolyl cis-trans isomerase SurA
LSKEKCLLNANPRVIRFTGAIFAAIFATAVLSAMSSCSRSSGSSGDVMAKVNSTKIMRSDVERFYKDQLAGAAQQPSEEQGAVLRLNVLRDLIDKEIFRQRAEKLGLVATDDEVQTKLNELKAPFTQEEFDKRLKAQGRTLDQLKEDLRRALTVDKVINKEITSKIEIKDSDIRDYYNAHKAEFNLIEPQFHVAHIFVTTQPGPVRNRKESKAQNDADAKRKIQMIANRLDSGEDFGTVAMDWSEDSETSLTGGDLGLLPESGLKQTDTATRDAVLKLKPGQYTGIIAVLPPGTKQVLGYRIVKLIAREPAGQRDLNDPRVQQAIRDSLRERREQLLKSAYYDVIRDEAKVENYFAEDVLKKTGAQAK